MSEREEDISVTGPVLSPAPFKEHEVEEYERKRYRGIDQKLVHAREMAILKRILERIAPQTGWMLDIPCGYGRFSGLLRRRGWDLVGSDYSFPMVKRAIDPRADTAMSRKWGVVADATRNLPFKDDTFSLLLCMRFWHHVHEEKKRRAVLHHFSRVTSQWVILSYYQVNAFHLIQRRFRKAMKKSSTRIKMISKAEFYDETRGAGFDCVAMFPLFKGIHSQHIALLKKIKT
jgi:SAM-dependent methyltransferase